MRTDILQSLNSGSEMQPRRMDGSKSKNRVDTIGLAMEKESSAKSRSFRKVFNEVAAGNRSAEKSSRIDCKNRNQTGWRSKSSCEGVENEDRDTMKTGVSDVALFLSDPEKSARDLFDNNNSGMSDGSDTVIVDDERAAAALEIVMEAFGELSDVLGIDFLSTAGTFSFSEIDGDTKAQFAEIVYVLKKMMQGMELSSKEGVSVELPGKSIEGKEVDAVTDTLRNSSFKIEIACTVLGISESVQHEVAIKMEQFDAAGIVQASNPQNLMMPQQHSERLFGTMFDGEKSAGHINELVANVKKMLEDATGEKTVIAVQSTVAKVNGKLDPANFEAGVYRALLKIDAMHKVGTQNEVAAENDADVPVQKGEPVLFTASALDESLHPEAISGHSDTEGVKAPAPLATGVEKTVSTALMQMTDDTVTKQITDKLPSMVRAGLTEVRIQLRPESLGDVKMRIRMEGDVVIAKIEVANQQVKEIIERNFGALKDALAQHNITAGSFDVSIGSGTGRHHGHAEQEHWVDDEDAHHFGQETENDDKHNAADESFTLNSDTGRRYGENSIEYFG